MAALCARASSLQRENRLRVSGCCMPPDGKCCRARPAWQRRVGPAPVAWTGLRAAFASHVCRPGLRAGFASRVCDPCLRHAFATCVREPGFRAAFASCVCGPGLRAGCASRAREPASRAAFANHVCEPRLRATFAGHVNEAYLRARHADGSLLLRPTETAVCDPPNDKGALASALVATVRPVRPIGSFHLRPVGLWWRMRSHTAVALHHHGVDQAA